MERAIVSPGQVVVDISQVTLVPLWLSLIRILHEQPGCVNRVTVLIVEIRLWQEAAERRSEPGLLLRGFGCMHDVRVLVVIEACLMLEIGLVVTE